MLAVSRDGLGPSDVQPLKDLERRNGQVKEAVPELSVDREILQGGVWKEL